MTKELSVIAKPLADEDKASKIYKTIKKAQKVKKIFYGVKSVNKAIRKGTKGIVVLAGDISPIDTISHYPVLCEESKIPYVFVDSKEELGNSCSTPKGMAVCFVLEPKEDEEYKETYLKLAKEYKIKKE